MIHLSNRLWVLLSGFILLLSVLACTNAKTEQTKVPTPKLSELELREIETKEMVTKLSFLATQSNPMDFYHMNSKRAAVYRDQLSNVSPQEKLSLWFKYSKELLSSGKSQACINQINNFIRSQKKPIPQILNDNNKQVFELYALAHLRLGEQINCQSNHTSASCIIPLQEPGFHLAKEGSQKAVEIYSLLLDRFPSEKYKWLLNVAYMTLGDYPNKVPSKYKLEIPNKTESQNFPFFNDIAMQVGVATNGLSGGTSVEDFNNDGYLDIFATSYGMTDNVSLHLNDTKGGFYDATNDAGLKGILSGLNCIHADYNNDGFTDIFILRGGWLGKMGTHPNSLLKNMGDGTFQDVTKSSNLLSFHPTQTASWADFDNDGHLDLFIGNESNPANGNHACELFRNNGDGTFSEVAATHGLGNILAYVKGVTWGDINNDGWPDLYVSVLGGSNRLFKNNGGNFTDITLAAKVQEPFNSFPCWFWDVNNDGLQDIFTSGYDLGNLNNLGDDYAKELQNIPTTTEKARLYINNGDDTFTESAEEFGISKSLYAMGANFGDLENDGYLDFYVGTGAPDFSTIVPNRMFKNVDGKSFKEVTSAGNFGHIQKGHGIAFADIDRDGDQDIYAVMGGAFEGDTFTNILYENPISKNNWIIIELEGTLSNTSAIGATIQLTLDNNKTVYRTVNTGGSFGASSLQQEIGLGQAKKIKEIIIHWPGQEKQVFGDIVVNQKLKIRQGSNDLEKPSYTYTPFKSEQEHMH